MIWAVAAVLIVGSLIGLWLLWDDEPVDPEFTARFLRMQDLKMAYEILKDMGDDTPTAKEIYLMADIIEEERYG